MLSKIVEPIPVSLLSKLSPEKLIIPYYHMISDHEVVHLKHLYRYKNTRQFSDDMDYLLKNYDPINLPELLTAIKNRKKFSKRSFLLTFDDGFRELFDVVAPILIRKGVPAVIFVNSAFVDNKELFYLHKASVVVESLKKNPNSIVADKISDILLKFGLFNGGILSSILSVSYKDRQVIDEIADCLEININNYLASNKPYLDSIQIDNMIRKGFCFGGHSIDHPLYRTISEEEQIRQTLQSVSWVKNKFSIDYGAFAFPHSDIGVSETYFEKIRESGNVDVLFGTGGLKNKQISDHLQRFSLEKMNYPAKRIVAYHYIKRNKYQVL